MPKYSQRDVRHAPINVDRAEDFFGLFLDSTRTYSGAYFDRDATAREDATLETAQTAKIDLALRKLGLQPGMTLLDIGCGWGAAMRRAVEKYDVNVVGLTLDERLADYAQQALDRLDSQRSRRVLVKGWETFDEPIDRILSINAFEHVGHERYADFFDTVYRLLPHDSGMVLETITALTGDEMREHAVPLTFSTVRFVKFILD